jgi:hypothetical protein
MENMNMLDKVKQYPFTCSFLLSVTAARIAVTGLWYSHQHSDLTLARTIQQNNEKMTKPDTNYLNRLKFYILKNELKLNCIRSLSRVSLFAAIGTVALDTVVAKRKNKNR